MGIKEKVSELKKKYGTNNPFVICERLGIWVYIVPLGNVEGHYTYTKRKKVFFINENLNQVQREFCCAHELGHALLHAKSNVYFNNSKTLVLQGKLECQANLFASELLVDDNLLENYQDYNLETISNCTGIDIKYLKLKFDK